MTNFYKKAGERILIVRDKRGYTRECLGELSGVSPKFIYEIETGKKGFSAVVLYKLCEALEIDSDYIMTGRQDINFDTKIANTLNLFEKEQMEILDIILRDIHKLSSNIK